jgi:site-specific DNA recombinase
LSAIHKTFRGPFEARIQLTKLGWVFIILEGAYMQFNEVIMYLRKSREDMEREKQTGDDILQSHRERLSELLISKGITKWLERAEVKTGDTIAARPVFQMVLKEDIPCGRFQAVCVTEISRLGRGDMEDAGRIYKTIIRYNIWIITPYKEYNPQNPADLRQIRFELFLSREEFEMIKDRLWQARDQKGKKGYAANYIVTLGFGQNRGRVFEIPEESRIVYEIFEMRSDGMSYYEIATSLNMRGLKTKRGTIYHNSTISKIIKNPRYIGKAKWCGQYYESKGPSIVPLELWNKVHQEIQPLRSVQRRTPKESTPYLVTLFCRECGNRLYGEWITIKRLLKSGHRKDYNEYGIYICVGRKKETPKCHNQHRIKHIHDLVLEELKAVLFKPEITKQLIEQRAQKHAYKTDTLLARVIYKKEEIKRKEEFLEKCKLDYKLGELAAPLYSEFYKETDREIGILQAEINELKNRIQKTTVKIEDPKIILSRLRDSLRNWDNMTNQQKKIIIAAFLPRIEISNDGILYVERNLPSYM